MANTVKKIKFFTIFQYDLEEEYLRRMSNNGFHFKSVIFPGIYTFEVREPEDIVYRLDFKGEAYKKEAEYTEMLRESGWEYITEMAEFAYYKKSGKEKNTELFSDRESKLNYLKSVAKRRMIPIGFIILFFVFNFFTSKAASSANFFSLLALVVYLILGYFLLKDYNRLKNKA